MKIDNKMPEQFFEWLNDCPVQWALEKSDKNVIQLTFLVPNSLFVKVIREPNGDENNGDEEERHG